MGRHHTQTRVTPQRVWPEESRHEEGTDKARGMNE
jgi:hypothetical protein